MEKTTPDVRVADYFTQAADSFDTFYDGKRNALMRWVDRTFRADVFIRYAWAFEEIGDAKGKTVLDIGCGSGPYSVEAARRGAKHVLGIDVARGMLDLARARADQNNVAQVCEFLEGSFPEDAPEEKYDHVVVTGVMDYVKDPAPFVAEIGKRVRQSAIISFPSIHWFRKPFREVRYWIKSCPVYFYRPDDIARWFDDAGFKSTELRKVKGAGQDYVAIARMS